MRGDESSPRLTAGDLDLVLAPLVGGAVASLTWRGADILRPLPAGSSEPLEAGCFPLVPFANRIARGKFTWDGREVRLPAEAVAEPHALHGQAWRRPWRVAARDGGSITLGFEHEAGQGGWPWAYRAEQRFTLGEAGLRIALSMTNLAEERAPAGLGLHPYFVTPAGSVTTLGVREAWINDDTLLPIQRVDGAHFADWAGGVALPLPGLIDNCHGGWNGRFDLRTPDRGEWRMTASADLAWLHLYAPPGAGFLCAEPVSHMPDAVNRPDPRGDTGLRVLEPGETWTVWMSLERKA